MCYTLLQHRPVTLLLFVSLSPFKGGKTLEMVSCVRPSICMSDCCDSSETAGRNFFILYISIRYCLGMTLSFQQFYTVCHNRLISGILSDQISLMFAVATLFSSEICHSINMECVGATSYYWVVQLIKYIHVGLRAPVQLNLTPMNLRGCK